MTDSKDKYCFKAYPTEFECTDETGAVVFNLKTFDQDSAQLEISTLVSGIRWPEISAMIESSLIKMGLDDPED